MLSLPQGWFFLSVLCILNYELDETFQHQISQ